MHLWPAGPWGKLSVSLPCTCTLTHPVYLVSIFHPTSHSPTACFPITSVSSAFALAVP